MPCYKKHKIFFYYCRMSIKQGLNTELSDSDLAIGIYDKDLFQEYNFCYRVYEIKKAFKENEYICNQCFKLLQKVKDEISPKIHIIWNENAQCKMHEFVQTFTIHLLITYLEKKMLAIKIAIYQKKLLVFI